MRFFSKVGHHDDQCRTGIVWWTGREYPPRVFHDRRVKTCFPRVFLWGARLIIDVPIPFTRHDHYDSYWKRTRKGVLLRAWIKIEIANYRNGWGIAYGIEANPSGTEFDNAEFGND